MLKRLAKQDSRWRSIALKLCKNKTTADDMVQDMYIKLKDYQTFNTSFIWYVLKHIHLGYLRKEKKEKKIDIGQLHYIKCNDHNYEPTDKEIEILSRYNDLNFVQQELLRENYDHSLREINERFSHINYGYAHRELKKARTIILKDEINKYQNSRKKR